MKHASIPVSPGGKAAFRLAALLLAFCLLMPALPAARAEAKPLTNLFGSALADQQDSIVSMALAGDTLYIRTNYSLYAYTPGNPGPDKIFDIENTFNLGMSPADEEGEQPAEPVLGAIFSDGERLLTLDSNAQTLYTVNLSGAAPAFENPLKLDLSEFVTGEEPYLFVQAPAWAKVIGGRLYLKAHNYEGKETDLFSFDLQTGEKKIHKAAHLQSASEYKDGTLIAVQSNPNDMYDMETGTFKKPELVVFNPADDSVTALGAYQPVNESYGNAAPIYYDANEDSLYTYTDTDVYRLEGDMKTPRLVGYLPMFGNNWMITSGGLQPLSDGQLAIAFGTNVFLRGRTGEGLENITVLTMSGGMDNPEILSRILMEMDDVVLRRVEGLDYNYVNAEQLASMFLTGNVTQDIMAINAYGFDLDKLIQKGYLADLSSSEKISGFMQSAAPNLSRPVMVDGKIYAVPGSIVLFPISAYIKPFEELGLTIPTSITGLLDLAEEWVGGLAEEHPDYLLINDGNSLKDSLRRIVMDKYVSNTLGAGQDLVFDTPVFRGLMQRVMEMDYGDLGLAPDWETEEGRAAMEELWNKKPLLETGMGFEPEYSVARYQGEDRAFKPLILPMEEGQPAYNEADINMLVVMSTSKNQEAAIRFLEHYLDKISPVNKAAFVPTSTAAIPNPNFDREQEQFNKNLKQLEAEYEKSEGARKSDLEESLKYMREYAVTLEKEGRYLATEADLARIHEVVSHLFVYDGLGNAQRQAFSNDYELQEQLFAGAISLDQFIRQVDDKLRLVRMEYQ